MSREWKPGDVALVNGTPITFFYKRDGSGHATNEVMFNNGAGYQHRAHHLAGCARRAVILDPEDREQVEGFARAYEATWSGGTAGSESTLDIIVRQMQAALRSLITPPKPEEPMADGAVVEDAEGARYIRVADNLAPWYKRGVHHTDRPWRYYRDIAAVKVLSPGVTP